MNLTDINVINSLKKKFSFDFKKSLGQNFLTDPYVCPEIAASSGGLGIGVLEIGPGFGVLTKELCEIAKKVVAVEIDTRLIPVLDFTLSEYDNYKIINSDVLKIDINKLIEEEFSGMDVVVAANLPYYITSPVIMALLESKLPIKRITALVQKEAADRLCAEPGSRDCGAISVAVNYFSKPQLLFTVEREAFAPPPKVQSAVISLEIRENPPVSPKEEALYFKVGRAAFAQRRKTAINSISSTLGVSKEGLSNILTNLGIDLNIRGERLTNNQICDIANGILSLK